MSQSEKQLAVLVGIAKRTADVAECEISLDELSRLADTAGAEVFAKVIQVKETYDPRTVIGSGKVMEIAELVKSSNIDLVIFDEELSPMQIRNLEKDIGNVTVLDRSMLILDIFALHATSGEGKLQVELAQLKYTAPRLVGKGLELSRQGGGIGTRGPGESKLETDRRHLREKLVALEHKLRELENNRATMRAQRDRSGVAKIALVGYTNAGKSTLLNALTGAGVLSEDKLFATLDPTTRKFTLPLGEEILITDTVGFIRKLPHHLVKAFKSTLDEVRYADVLLIICDASDKEAEAQLKVTEQVIAELEASDKPKIYVMNKVDKCEFTPQINAEDTVFVSAKTKMGLDALVGKIQSTLLKTKREVALLIPYTDQGVVSNIYNEYSVKETDYADNGVKIVAVLDERGIGLYRRYIV